MKEITIDTKNIAFCGLYCGACGKYLKESCRGCEGNEKATWCKVRSCCMENGYKSCADCTIIDPAECKKLNNFIAKVFGLIFKSDRKACIDYIKNNGYEAFATAMANNKTMTFKRK